MYDALVAFFRFLFNDYLAKPQIKRILTVCTSGLPPRIGLLMQISQRS